IIFFAYLHSPAYKTKYGKTHVRTDIKIPIYIKYSKNRLHIYEFGHTDESMGFYANLNGARGDEKSLLTNSAKRSSDTTIFGGTYYVNSNLNSDKIQIYEDEKMQRPLHVTDTIKNQSFLKTYEIYGNDTNSPLDTQNGINLLDGDNKMEFIRKFNEVKAKVNVKDGESVMLIVESGDIVFPLKIKPLNDKGQSYDWSVDLDDARASQAIFGSSRKKRKHAARDLYTNIVTRNNENEIAFSSDVQIVSIAEGKVLNTGSFYHKTDQITILHESKKFGKFIIRYGEVDPSRIQVKERDKVRAGDLIGYAGFMVDEQTEKHPYIVSGKIVTMLHFEYFTDGENTKGSLTNRSNTPFSRRSDLADPLEILKEGYKNTFGEEI
ncbi:MAG: M23 family metallopeptidase, partial [Campylobacter sp.]|nr:M23 family metallopeptidase [Campylobacter sp.]